MNTLSRKKFDALTTGEKSALRWFLISTDAVPVNRIQNDDSLFTELENEITNLDEIRRVVNILQKLL